VNALPSILLWGISIDYAAKKVRKLNGHIWRSICSGNDVG